MPASVTSRCLCSCDLDPMTLIYELNLDILNTHKFLGQGFQKLEHEQDRQTDRQTHRWKRSSALPAALAVFLMSSFRASLGFFIGVVERRAQR